MRQCRADTRSTGSTPSLGWYGGWADGELDGPLGKVTDGSVKRHYVNPTEWQPNGMAVGRTTVAMATVFLSLTESIRQTLESFLLKPALRSRRPSPRIPKYVSLFHRWDPSARLAAGGAAQIPQLAPRLRGHSLLRHASGLLIGPAPRLRGGTPSPRARGFP